MVEFQMAKRGTASFDRRYVREISGSAFQLLPLPFPKVAALVPTFDCEGRYGGGTNNAGESEIVPAIQDHLEKINSKGTFNFVGMTAIDHAAVVKDLYYQGHDVWGHGYSHVYLDGDVSLAESEVDKTIEAIFNITGQKCVGWRSPYGTFDGGLYKILVNKGIQFGSNWGSSTWGSLPFTPIVDGNKISIAELPFDDVHFDAMVFRKLNLKPNEVLNLYKSKLSAAVNSMSIFTLLAHPVNIAEDPARLDMLVDLFSFASHTPAVWVASCSEVLHMYSSLKRYKISKFEQHAIKSGICLSITVSTSDQTLGRNLFDDVLNACCTAVYVVRDLRRVRTCTSNFEVVDLSPFEQAVCMPVDLAKNRIDLDFEIETG